MAGFLGCFIDNNQSGCYLTDVTLLNLLLNLICKITNDVSLQNSNHLKKFDDGKLVYNIHKKVFFNTTFYGYDVLLN